jgi:hypothetical protein
MSIYLKTVHGNNGVHNTFKNEINDESVIDLRITRDAETIYPG